MPIILKPVLKPEKPKSLRPNPIPIFISPSYLQHPGVQSRHTLQRLIPLRNPDGFNLFHEPNRQDPFPYTHMITPRDTMVYHTPIVSGVMMEI